MVWKIVGLGNLILALSNLIIFMVTKDTNLGVLGLYSLIVGIWLVESDE